MFLVKLMRVFRLAKCKLAPSTWIPIALYIIFITFMLSITFPNGRRSLKPHSYKDPETSSETLENQDQGELNRVFHSDGIKDIFQESMVLSDNKDASNILKFAFRKADANSDKTLTIREVAKYINLKICKLNEVSCLKPRLLTAILEIESLCNDSLIRMFRFFNR